MKLKVTLALLMLFLGATACKTTSKYYAGPYRIYDTNKPESNPTYTLEEVEQGVIWFLFYPIPYVRVSGLLLCEEDKTGKFDMKCK